MNQLFNDGVLNGGAGDGSVPIYLEGYGFGVSDANNLAIVGYGFGVEAEMSFVPDPFNEIEGYGFAAVGEVVFGSEISGYGFAAEGDFDLVPANDHIVVSGYGFGVVGEILANYDWTARLEGYGFATVGQIETGAELSGYGFSAAGDFGLSDIANIGLSGYGFNASGSFDVGEDNLIALSGYGFNVYDVPSYLFSGYGFSAAGDFFIALEQEFGFATVMNVTSGECTRYSSFPFFDVVRVAGNNYGVNGQGLWLLDGDSDDGIPVNGVVKLKATDFGAYQSKNVPYVYVNADSPVKVTPIVDGQAYLPHTANYGGRKTHLARGVKGRYWQFQVENIDMVEGIEPLPELKQRRVK